MINARNLISVAFAVLLALMSALVASGLWWLDAIDRNLQEITLQLDTKTNLVWEMRHAARERALLLHHLVDTADPFQRDEELQAFNRQAGIFIAARDRLRALPLSPEEGQALDRSLELARVGEAAQQAVVELVESGRLREASALLRTRVVQVQNSVLAQLTEMTDAQQQSARAARKDAERAYRSATFLTMGIGCAVLAIGAAVAIYVGRRTAHIEKALESEKARAQLTLHAIGDAVVACDLSGRVTYLNRVAEKLTGWNLGEIDARPVAELLDLRDGSTGERLAEPLAADGGEAKRQGQLHSRRGERWQIEYHVGAIRDDAGTAVGTVIVLHDVTRATELSQQLSWAATHDALTGLINRSEFERRLTELLVTANNERREHALLYLDLDQFKVVNDTCGHMAGDELLRQLSARLAARVRSNDTLARLGGDEFGVLLAGCPLERAAAIAEELRDTVAQARFVWADKVFETGVSIGVVPINAAAESPHALLSAVDAACYAAKDEGRNRVHVLAPGDEEIARRQGEMAWAQRLAQAINDNRLELYSQRIVPVQAGAPGLAHHHEILVRMRDETGAMVPPMAFIPAAERYQLMGQLDRWVIRAVFQRLARIPRQAGAYCAINLSGQSLGDREMRNFILAEFAATGAAPENVCFEITETSAIANLAAATDFIKALREVGCRFALDDFGSGMSSFGYLSQLHVDYLKIDGFFVRRMLSNPGQHAMVEAIHRIGHVMGLQTIAEFVEDEATLAALRAIGVDFAQGYGIHVPEPLPPLTPLDPLASPAT